MRPRAHGSAHEAADSLDRVEVSNADRVVFPRDGITKGEVVDYYRAVASRLLPFLAGRALTLERYPQGIGAKGFMQKNAPAHFPDDLIDRHEVPKEGGTTVYPVVHTEEAIEFLANLGVITFHTPPSTVDDWRHPDWIIWDLDPPEGRVELVRDVARKLRAGLEAHSIPTVLMTSGSKGYHVRARVDRSVEWDTMARMARGLAALIANENEGTMTLEFRKSERRGRVFVDWLRNAPYSTSVAPWCLRARPGAPVAAPLRWEELDEVDPDGVHLGSIAERLDTTWWSEPAATDLRDLAERIDDELEAAGIVLEPFDRFRS